ncbi:DUF3054 domain-containing protein [Nocardioides sp. AE5]|uniref:DUF3054 domain-containing protein n=1 Tax=Nocardioides sp. AE5 TaxID=2962573 RepID=UPI002880C08E|nr:DUF3054 domain-containing protein [Nocardioides sp. AE5]MDT0203552.1 DUF3054 domain-containing protein [Nocardioides sp. AE5]
MPRSAATALAVDALLVVVFAAIGRAEHERGNAILGALTTAWPFLVGLAVGWILVRQLGRRWALDLGAGITIWISTVFLGMVLRQVSGQGTAFSFIVVATLVLGAFLLGARLVRGWLARSSLSE